MKRCYECGKKLRLWEGYIHPTLGGKILVCSKCFKNVEKSMEKYRNFILNEFKQNRSERKKIILKKNSKFFKLLNNSNITH